ncbi:MAG: ATP-dependent RNA helicase RhlB [Gammaproteobacteria bacterium]
MSDTHLSDITFASLGLPAELMQGIEGAGFSRCTPIQAQCLPLALHGRDVAGQAQTGTGKTAAFLLATMTHLGTHAARAGRAHTQPRALILAPTRELAIQIHKDALLLAAHSVLRLGLVYGGTGYESQRKVLEEGVDILIGTPGRIIDYFKQHVFDLKAIQVMVLDEADRMFDLGFINDIRYLLRRMPDPAERLNMLFSATLSMRVTELAYEHMNNPELVRIETDKITANKVTQALYHTANEDKIPLLLGLLQHMDPHRTIVFVNTKRAADKVWAYLEGNGIQAAVLSGDVPQTQRQNLLQKFQRGDLPVLVATDVAARGLHIPEVSHVFNYDLPQDAEDYVHRIGRTARLGASGDAISFACEEFVFSLPEIETYIGHKIPVMPISESLLAKPLPPVKSQRRPRPAPRAEQRGKAGQRAHGRSRPRS